MTIKLYDLVGEDAERPFSPHCWKVRMALAHKGLDAEVVPVRFREVASLEGGSNRTVPLIRDGDKVVQDSFAIAEYLDDAYPDRPTLFGGDGGRGVARFVENWSSRTLHPAIVKAVILDLFTMQDAENRTFFRQTREATFGKPLEAVQDGRGEEKRAAVNKSLEPLRATLRRQPFVAGGKPLFVDYIVFGAFQWMRIASVYSFLEEGDPIRDWFERCLDLYDGMGRATPAAEAA